MHPSNWKQMSHQEKIEEARGLLESERGRLLIAQALAHAIHVMRKEEHPEVSNIEDMEALGLSFEPLFSWYMAEVTLKSQF